MRVIGYIIGALTALVLVGAFIAGLSVPFAWFVMLVTSAIGHIFNIEKLTLISYGTWFAFSFAVITAYLILFPNGQR